MEYQPQIGDLIKYHPLHGTCSNLAIVTNVDYRDVRVLWTQERRNTSQFEWLPIATVSVIARA